MKVVILLLGLMARTAVSQISGAEMMLPDGETTDDGVQVLWFSQTLDHYSSGTPTYWKQRYMINEKPWSYYGKPQNTAVFLKIGGEGPIGRGWMKGGSWVQWAWNHCALLFQLEHRFYGESRPTKDVSDANLKYLTSEQAIQDIKTFIEAMNKQYNFTSKNKWFVFGGSYPGNLVAWSRLKLPKLISGGVSSSGPLEAEADFYQYNNVVRDNLELYYPGCGKEVTKAVKSIQNTFASGTPTAIEQLTTKFNVCSGFDHRQSKNQNVFYQAILGTIARAVQYNNIGESHERIQYVCYYMTYYAVQDPVDRLAMLQKSVSKDCLYANYNGVISYFKEKEWESNSVNKSGRQWLWQTCNEFGYYQTSSTTKSLYSDTLPLKFFEDQCTSIFGARYNGRQLNAAIAKTNRNYQGWNIRVENIVFVQGSVDPWHPLGMIRNQSPKSPLIFINGTTHTQDMNNNSPQDPPNLVKARQKIENYLSQWMQA